MPTSMSAPSSGRQPRGRAVRPSSSASASQSASPASGSSGQSSPTGSLRSRPVIPGVRSAVARGEAPDIAFSNRASSSRQRSEGSASPTSASPFPSKDPRGLTEEELQDMEEGRRQPQEEQQRPEVVEDYFSFSISHLPASLKSRVAVHVAGVLVCAAVGLSGFLSQPSSRGFFCADTSIKYPYIQVDTVPISLVVVFAIAVPAILILALEALHHMTHSEAPAKNMLIGMYVHLGAFALAMTGCFAITDVIKQTVGGLRPHFLAVCLPDNVQCTDSDGNPAYIQGRFKWQNPKRNALRVGQEETRLQREGGGNCRGEIVNADDGNTPRRNSALLQLWLFVDAMVPALQVLLLLAALYIGASRIADFKHHTRDVFAGLLVGALTALHGAFFVIDVRNSHAISIWDL